jgi:hypothetical protein
VRVLAGIGLAALTAAGAAALAILAGRAPPRELLPDLEQAVPAAVALRREDGRELVVFASAVDNVGEGPLEVRAARDPGDATMSLRQVVRRADGSAEESSAGGFLRYQRAETHAHWHLIGFERYELRDSDGLRVVTARKAGFCLGDRYDTRRSARLRGEPRLPVWTDECGKNQPGLTSLVEGISVGYGDDYAPRLEGQYVDVTGLAPGRYVLVHLVNLDRTLRESSYENNAASVALRLGPDGLEILARCPDSSRCP